jgi:hypothetical protein
MRAAILALLLGATAARADSIDRSSYGCERGIVQVGDLAAIVRNRCGEPTRADHHDTEIARDGVYVRSTIDVWTYDHGPRKLVVVLTFIDGALRRIELDGYGTP